MSTPVLIRGRDMIRTVATRWHEQYPKRRQILPGDTEDIYDRLAALDRETATAEDVESIIGVGGWVRLLCDGCGEYADPVVRVGAEPDYESATANLCVPCLRQALAIAEKEQP